ncbi:carbonic anhydrase 4b [Tachysurus vachellii]|uniref:carbonic anhydrase 4b n=1 Tax=Tachysurus vachellii TaxID=175792 RepID=UPI00296AE53C|nr:carbonic anhydrase 4b [Tachysurus vachellii]
MEMVKLLVLLVSVLGMTGGVEWCYESQVSCDNNCKGPDEWKDIASACGGQNQSPINIVTKRVINHTLKPLIMHGYQEFFQSIITNNGHTVKVNLSGDAVIEGAGLSEKYKAVEVHFHWGKNGGPGSEHTIDGERYPMEMHIVHIKETYSTVQEAVKDRTGIAVLGFLYQESDSANKKYDSIINALPQISLPGNKTTLGSVNLEMLLPDDPLARYFRYSGSLTTPDCAESVIWTLFESTIPLSHQQLSAFSDLWFVNGTAMIDNFRPVQPLNGRDVFYSGSNTASVSTLLAVSTLIVTIMTL